MFATLFARPLTSCYNYTMNMICTEDDSVCWPRTVYCLLMNHLWRTFCCTAQLPLDRTTGLALYSCKNTFLCTCRCFLIRKPLIMSAPYIVSPKLPEPLKEARLGSKGQSSCTLLLNTVNNATRLGPEQTNKKCKQKCKTIIIVIGLWIKLLMN